MLPAIFATTTPELNAVWRGIKQILLILLSPDLQHQLWPLQIIFVVMALFFGWMVVYYSLKTSYWDNKVLGDMKNFLFPKIFERKAQLRRWQKIEKGLKKNYQDQWKLSLIDAAGFLDEVLKSAGYGGANLEERLQKVTTDDLLNIQELINAQKVYSDIMRDPDYRLTKAMAQDTINQIESALKELGVL